MNLSTVAQPFYASRAIWSDVQQTLRRSDTHDMTPRLPVARHVAVGAVRQAFLARALKGRMKGEQRAHALVAHDAPQRIEGFRPLQEPGAKVHEPCAAPRRVTTLSDDESNEKIRDYLTDLASFS